jgi:hypothetical protein
MHTEIIEFMGQITGNAMTRVMKTLLVIALILAATRASAEQRLYLLCFGTEGEYQEGTYAQYNTGTLTVIVDFDARVVHLMGDNWRFSRDPTENDISFQYSCCGQHSSASINRVAGTLTIGRYLDDPADSSRKLKPNSGGMISNINATCQVSRP